MSKHNIILSTALLLFFASLNTTLLKASDTYITSLPKNAIEGSLKNGIHYILMPGKQSTHKIEMRLVMCVGSLVETNKQRGGAHFLEHLAFEGTKNFPNRSLVNLFEEKGMKYGRDINAYTGFDRTVYCLTLPTANKQESKDRTKEAIIAAKEWLCNIDITKKNVDKERGVIAEEIRSYVTNDNFYKLKIGNGRHAKRMPLGTETDIKNISTNDIINYYNKWYKPNKATIILVGDFDANNAKQQIKETLSDIKKVKAKNISFTQKLHYNKGVKWQQITDSLQRQSKIELIIPHSEPALRSVKDMINNERRKLLIDLLAERIRLSNIKCDVSDEWYLADKYHLAFTFNDEKKDSLLKNIERLSAECKRISKQGFCSKEIKNAIEKRKNKILNIDNNKPISEYCNDLIDYVVLEDKHIYNKQQANYLANNLDNTSNKDIVKYLNRLLRRINKQMLITYITNGKDFINKEEVIKHWNIGKTIKTNMFIYNSEKQKNYTKMMLPACLTDNPDFNKEIIDYKKYYTNIDITEVKLKNGLKIILRPTYSNDTNIYVALIARSGTEDLSTKDKIKYYDATAYVDMNGIKNIMPDSLSNIMINNNLSMAVGIDNYQHQILASAPNKHIKELFNLMYQKIMFPAIDYKAFNQQKNTELKNIGKETLLQKMIKYDVDRIIQQRIDSLTAINIDKKWPILTRQNIENLSIDSLTQYYKKTFARMHNATLVITGNFNKERVIKLAAAIFSQIIPIENDTLIDRKEIISPNKYKETFICDNDKDKATINVIMAFNYKTGLKNSLKLKIMRDLLQDKLIAVLREKLNIVYSPYADLYYNGIPQQKAMLWITTDTKKENIDIVEQNINNIIKQLQHSKADIRDLEKIKQSFIVTKRMALNNNTPIEWKNAIISLIKNGESIDDFDKYEEILNSISAEDIRKMFNEKINTKKQFIFIKTNE